MEHSLFLPHPSTLPQSATTSGIEKVNVDSHGKIDHTYQEHHFRDDWKMGQRGRRLRGRYAITLILRDLLCQSYLKASPVSLSPVVRGSIDVTTNHQIASNRLWLTEQSHFTISFVPGLIPLFARTCFLCHATAVLALCGVVGLRPPLVPQEPG